MTKVAKVTVSLPAGLLEFVEQRRRESGASRSGTITQMLWQVRQEAELTERAARYEAAYARQPETSEERVFAESAGQSLAGAGDEWPETPSWRGPRAAQPRQDSSTERSTPTRRAGSKPASARAVVKPIRKEGKRAPR